MTNNKMFGKEVVNFRHLNGGVQYLYKFNNNFGASVVQHQISYGGDQGLWEVAVIRWRGNGYDLDYDTPITNDVIGFLTDENVKHLLEDVEHLTEEGKFQEGYNSKYSIDYDYDDEEEE